MSDPMSLNPDFLTMVAEAQFYLMSAQRGPDYRSSDFDIDASIALEPALAYLKQTITRRIRRIIWRLDWSFAPIDVEGIKSAALQARDHVHFLSHLADAVCMSSKHPIWEGKGREVCEALKSII